jgi:hypothetical protein
MTLSERVRAVLSQFYLADYDLAAAENDAGAMTAAMKGFADLHALRFQPPAGDRPAPEQQRYKVNMTYE